MTWPDLSVIEHSVSFGRCARQASGIACFSRRQTGDLRHHNRTVTLKCSAKPRDDFVESQTLLRRHAAYLPSDNALMILSVTSSLGLTQTTS